MSTLQGNIRSLIRQIKSAVSELSMWRALVLGLQERRDALEGDVSSAETNAAGGHVPSLGAEESLRRAVVKNEIRRSQKAMRAASHEDL